MPTSQGPLKKGLAIAKTSLGVNAMSKALGIADPVAERMFKIV